jgi:hypothetical protein
MRVLRGLLNLLLAPSQRLKGIGEILRFMHDLPLCELQHRDGCRHAKSALSYFFFCCSEIKSAILEVGPTVSTMMI